VVRQLQVDRSPSTPDNLRESAFSQRLAGPYLTPDHSVHQARGGKDTGPAADRVCCQLGARMTLLAVTSVRTRGLGFWPMYQRRFKKTWNVERPAQSGHQDR
jgi:hypothetical protein